MRAFRSLLVTAAALACLAGNAQAEEKILRLYNWADYFAEDTSAASPPRPASRSSMT